MRTEDKGATVTGGAGGTSEQVTPVRAQALALLTRGIQTWRNASWIIRFPVMALAGVVAIVALCWIVFGFGSLGLDPTATFAAVIGITLTVGLGVGLMTLVFYSDRSGQDDAVRDKTVARRDT